MIETPELVNVSSRQIAYIHLTVPRDEIQNVMGPGIVELVGAITAQKLAITGPWFTHHLRRPTDSFDFKICFPISAAIIPSGRIESGVINAMSTVQTMYQGPYEGLGEAWGEFLAWIENANHQTGDDLYECYLLGPQTTEDSSLWRTQLSRQLIDSI